MKQPEGSESKAVGAVPRITFGMIVLNGEPFTRYNLRSLYPWAHQIIVVEGACPAAASVATSDGHSTDGTLEVIKTFMRDEDPEGKLILVTAEDEGHENGFWTEKDEMSQAYAQRATGDYLWQVDSDEFYTDSAFEIIIATLREGYDTVSVPVLQYWGSPRYLVNGFSFLSGYSEFHRVFRWGPGYHYHTHRPPTVLAPDGTDLRARKWFRASFLAERGAQLHHLSTVLPKQALEKAAYYSAVPWTSEFRAAEDWRINSFERLRRPFRPYFHSCVTWLERAPSTTPKLVEVMWDDLVKGAYSDIALRPTADIERLLSNPLYRTACSCLRLWAIPVRLVSETKTYAKRLAVVQRLLNWRRCRRLKNQ